MSDIQSSDFPVSKDAYLAFDGLTIKEKIRQRLNQTGVFTDQNFEGSNLTAINDSVAMSFSLLIYYLNKTSNEGQFSEAQIYENINRIVKELSYKPIGHQTASVSYSLSAKTLNAGIYTIPRYSFVTVGGMKYSFVDDYSFSKPNNSVTESIDDNGNNLLFQGALIEYPTVTPAGNGNEIIYLTTNSTDIIDNFNIHVYVKPLNGKWKKWDKTQSLFLHDANAPVFELRFNENKRYELKFGNDINGKKLVASDSVAIYYLKSDGKNGEIGANTLAGKKLNGYTTVRYNQIMADLETNSSYLTNGQFDHMLFDNPCTSTWYNEPESVESIKQNAPANFHSQFRLVITNDYEVFTKTNFANIVHDVKCVKNRDYLDSYIKYFYSLGLTKPQLESRAMFNQARFADACNFNNLYLFTVPKSIGTTLSYLTPAQKNLITETMAEEMTSTADVIVMDPVYLAVDLAMSDSNEITVNDIPETVLLVEKQSASRRSDDSIKADVANAIRTYFSRSSLKLGQTISVNDLTNQILAIAGVKKISTMRSDTGNVVNGLNFIIWNPVYSDITVNTINGNYVVENFQFPYLFTDDLESRIVIDDALTQTESII